MYYDKVERDIYRQELIQQDICPECYSELDTGYECNDCGFDAIKELRPEYKPIIHQLPPYAQ